MKDNCQVCRGERGGARGNENRIDGLIVCDYCDADESYKVIIKAREQGYVYVHKKIERIYT